MSGGRKGRTMRRAGGATHWVQLEHYLIDSAAYRALSPNARAVYTDLKRRYNGKNNGLISFSTREAAACIGFTNDTGARALKELLDHGFVEVTEDSNFSRKVRVARQYRLTEAADDRPGVSRIATKDFLKWSPHGGSKSKTQSDPSDNTVLPIGRGAGQVEQVGNHSLTHRTVAAKSAVPQSYPSDTYISSASQGARNGTR